MSSTRRTALVAGVCYLVTFVSIPTLTLYTQVKSGGYILGAGPDTAALWGGLLEVIVALAGIGTAVTLFPVVRRYGESRALGFVAARVLEAAMIFAGVVSILSLVTLRHTAAAGADPATLVLTGQGLVAQYNLAFLLGQSLMPGLNALLLGTLLYTSGLVPRAIPVVGLIGAPIHLTAVLLTLFGVLDRISPVTLLAALPIAAWEFSLGVYLVARGFARPVPEVTGAPATDQRAALPVG